MTFLINKTYFWKSWIYYFNKRNILITKTQNWSEIINIIKNDVTADKWINIKFLKKPGKSLENITFTTFFILIFLRNLAMLEFQYLKQIGHGLHEFWSDKYYYFILGVFFYSVTYDFGTAKVKALWITFIKQLRLGKLILQQLSPTSIWVRGGRLGY